MPKCWPTLVSFHLQYSDWVIWRKMDAMPADKLGKWPSWSKRQNQRCTFWLNGLAVQFSWVTKWFFLQTDKKWVMFCDKRDSGLQAIRVKILQHHQKVLCLQRYWQSHQQNIRMRTSSQLSEQSHAWVISIVFKYCELQVMLSLYQTLFPEKFNSKLW